MPILPVPIPFTSPIAKPRDRQKYPNADEKDPEEGKLPDEWVTYLSSQAESTAAAVQRLFMVELTQQDTSLGATDISNGALTSGLYSFRYYARVTRAASINSSLTVTFDWRDGGGTLTFSDSAITGNTTTSYGEQTVLIHVDGAAPVRYSTTYASAGATTMQYSLYVVLERVNA